jgi:predicted HAD superfamily Cof-like phosphohydrolase
MDSETLQRAYDHSALRKHYDDFDAEKKELAKKSYDRVKEFMVKFGHPVYETPGLIENQPWEAMRVELIREELCELMDALGYGDAADQIRAVYINPDEEYDRDIVAAADALGDLEYVVNGAAIGMGINLPAVVREIHRSNMTKLGADGEPIYREDGKILKGPDYEPPNLEKALGLTVV